MLPTLLPACSLQDALDPIDCANSGYVGLHYFDGKDPVPLSPCVPSSRTVAALDMSSVCMTEALNQILEAETCGAFGREKQKNVVALGDSWNKRHVVVTEETPMDAEGCGSRPSKKKLPPDPHRKCRCSGVQMCKGLLGKFAQQIAAAVKAICSTNKELHKDNLLSGFWFLGLRGKETQRKLEHAAKSGPSSQDEGLLLRPVGPDEVRFLHISFVLGGLKQFYPVFAEFKPTTGVALPEAEWAGRLELQFCDSFVDLFQLVQMLDINREWFIQAFELKDNDSAVADVVPGLVTVDKLSEQYCAWRGAASHNISKRQQTKSGGALMLFKDAFSSRSRSNPEGQRGQPSALAQRSGVRAIDLGPGDQNDSPQLVGPDPADDASDNEFDYFGIPSDDGCDSDQELELAQAFLAELELGELEDESLQNAASSSSHARAPAVPVPAAPPPLERLEPVAVAEELDPASHPPPHVEQMEPPNPGSGPRQRHDGLVVRAVSGGAGLAYIKHKPQVDDVFLVCPYHKGCSKTRTLHAPSSSAPAGRRGQGRPLGYLAAWLLQGAGFTSKGDHFASVPSFAERVAARTLLKEEPNWPEFAQLERSRGDGEGSEPENFS